MMMKVNKSEYVTIRPPSFRESRNGWRRLSAPLVSILYCHGAGIALCFSQSPICRRNTYLWYSINECIKCLYGANRADISALLAVNGEYWRRKIIIVCCNVIRSNKETICPFATNHNHLSVVSSILELPQFRALLLLIRRAHLGVTVWRRENSLRLDGVKISLVIPVGIRVGYPILHQRLEHYHSLLMFFLPIMNIRHHQ